MQRESNRGWRVEDSHFGGERQHLRMDIQGLAMAVEYRERQDNQLRNIKLDLGLGSWSNAGPFQNLAGSCLASAKSNQDLKTEKIVLVVDHELMSDHNHFVFDACWLAMSI